MSLPVLQKQRARLVAAREEMDRTIQAIDVVMNYLRRVSPGRVGNTDQKKKYHMTPEGAARRLAGYRAWQKRAKTKAKGASQ